jgi:hypothetical protein
MQGRKAIGLGVETNKVASGPPRQKGGAVEGTELLGGIDASATSPCRLVICFGGSQLPGPLNGLHF